MKVQVLRPLSFSAAAAIAFAAFAASAQPAPMMGGDMKGGGMMGGDMKGEDMMKGGDMKGEDMMKGCDMMGGGMMGGDMSRMTQMMSMMHEKLAHSGDRIAALKTSLKITEAQTPAWNKFADALLAASKSMDESMEAMHKQMMASGGASLPEKLEHHAKMAAEHLTSLQAIKTALAPLYASLSDEQKKLADEQKIGPMGVM